MFRIVAAAIDAEALEWSRAPSDGGVVTFLGVVREDADDGSRSAHYGTKRTSRWRCVSSSIIANEAREKFGDVQHGDRPSHRRTARRREFRLPCSRPQRIAAQPSTLAVMRSTSSSACADLEEGALRGRNGAVERRASG